MRIGVLLYRGAMVFGFQIGHVKVMVEATETGTNFDKTTGFKSQINHGRIANPAGLAGE